MDYKLLIGSEDYDVNDPENAVYNAKFTSTSYLNQVAKDGAKNWFIYDVIKDPTGSMETQSDQVRLFTICGVNMIS
mgnify:CR=1 FL=1